MRLAALALVALVGGVGPGWAVGVEDTIAKLRTDLARAPGSYVGCVPGGCLRAQMHSLAPSQLVHIPLIDVDKVCRNDAVCINAEQSSYDQVKYLWDILTENGRDVCIAVANDLSKNGIDSTFYRRMKYCVIIRLQSEAIVERQSPQHFQP